MSVAVCDPDDPRIALFRDVRERDLKGRHDLYMAEGEVVLRLLLARDAGAIRAVLLSQSAARRMESALAALPAPVYVVDQQVMDTVVGFHIHRGILALVARPPEPDPAALIAGAGRRRVLGLLGITNHDNMGGIFRNAAAFGADAVLIDAASCDPLYRKAIRVSVGASLIVPFARVPDGPALLALLAQAGYEAIALSPAGATPLSAYRPPDRAAALFGTEGPGLSAQILATARPVSIPMAGGFDSLNVATTSGIVLHHLTQF